jgi:L,D-peptidoglycan transpeptidase YkuD (ErfK/YbiS/YcfS/YnhG family)
MLATAKILGLLACLALCGTTLARESIGGTPSCQNTLANQLASTESATQLVTVAAPLRSSTRGVLRLWRKSGDCWFPAGGPWPAWLGERGVSNHHREGDHTTPTGAYGFGPVVYGLAPNPGVRYRYHRIVCGDWWVEDPRSPSYNRFRHEHCNAAPPFRVTSEDLSRSPTAYRHFAVIGYNTDLVVPGRGSGIFLHASRGRPTLGCVSLELPKLVTVLRWLRPARSPLIVIGTAATIRRY